MDILERIDLYFNEFKLDYSDTDKKTGLTDKYIEIMNNANKKLKKRVNTDKKLIGQYDTILGGNKSVGGY